MQESVIYQDIKEQGVQQGLQQGLKRQASLVVRQLKHCIGKIESEDEIRITELSIEQLEALGEALFDFSSGRGRK
ncbi:hypothetical protein Xen7305DRAFT_00026640 [Xenococcus sp. PCC 7305]|uniref:DUF4351 domain-containing protein n=1 Tax=Xenococcus sp. PCC 7305 TaxID=102125 RepID=UPI0002AC7790|nr:DUF4351 domain-containing protein [Xenococcus sp. PCC 7305]ELS02946.1 hypothetical protein Xen7305DRAFT_00026640 [Xenococcus sp. PCC 7305]